MSHSAFGGAPLDEDRISPLKGRADDAWQKGFAMGFRIGASDKELASVEVPGAHGMISGFSEEILEQFGFFTTCE